MGSGFGISGVECGYGMSNVGCGIQMWDVRIKCGM